MSNSGQYNNYEDAKDQKKRHFWKKISQKVGRVIVNSKEHYFLWECDRICFAYKLNSSQMAKLKKNIPLMPV